MSAKLSNLVNKISAEARGKEVNLAWRPCVERLLAEKSVPGTQD
jgi:hypothetical protein